MRAREPYPCERLSTLDIGKFFPVSEYLDNMTLGRVGSADDVAAAVHFLSGPSASWITGVCLPVDGGHHLRRSPRFDGYVRSQHGTQWLAEPLAASLD